MKAIKRIYSDLLLMISVMGITILISSCTLDRSTLINDNRITNECRIVIEAFYYMQRNTDKSSIVELARSCRESNRFVRCEKYIKNRTLFAECRALLK